MALETGTFIDDLVTTNPVTGDLMSQGDDHLRLIKSVLKATFPNLDEAVAIETGIWTPTFTFASPGDLAVSYTGQTGRYLRVGPVVFLRLILQFTPTFTSANGQAQMGGLPFVPGTIAGVVTPSIFSGVTYTETLLQCSLLPVNSTSHLLAVSIGIDPAEPHKILGTPNFVSEQAIDIRAAGMYWV